VLFRSALNYYKMKNHFKYRLVDLHTLTYVNYISRGLEPPLEDRHSAVKSYKIFEYCGIPDEPRPHNALNGAKYEAEALSRLVYGKNLLKDFARFPIPDYLKTG